MDERQRESSYLGDAPTGSGRYQQFLSVHVPQALQLSSPYTETLTLDVPQLRGDSNPKPPRVMVPHPSAAVVATSASKNRTKPSWKPLSVGTETSSWSEDEEEVQDLCSAPDSTKKKDIPKKKTDATPLIVVTLPEESDGAGSNPNGADAQVRVVRVKWRTKGKRRVVLPLLKFGCQRCMQTMKQKYHRHFQQERVGTKRRCCQTCTLHWSESKQV